MIYIIIFFYPRCTIRYHFCFLPLNYFFLPLKSNLTLKKNDVTGFFNGALNTTTWDGQSTIV